MADAQTQPQTTSEDTDERVRRDALARLLCAHLCDDRRTLDELTLVDRALFGCLLETIGRMRYAIDDAGKSSDRDYRVGWNHALDNVERVLRGEL